MNKAPKFTGLKSQTDRKQNYTHMKKIIFTAVVIVCSVVTNQMYSQTEGQCYSFEKNENGDVENIQVKLTFNGTKVEVDYKKQSQIKGETTLVTISKQGVVEGDKIIFIADQAVKMNGAQTNQNTPWTLKGGTLIAGEEVLKSVSCN
jgi:hypothetical protein